MNDPTLVIHYVPDKSRFNVSTGLPIETTAAIKPLKHNTSRNISPIPMTGK